MNATIIAETETETLSTPRSAFNYIISALLVQHLNLFIWPDDEAVTPTGLFFSLYTPLSTDKDGSDSAGARAPPEEPRWSA